MSSFAGLVLLTYEEATEKGIPCPKPPKKKEVCEYCGKEHSYKGFVNDGEITVLHKISCRCVGAETARKEKEKKHNQHLVAEEEQRLINEAMQMHDDGINERYRRRGFDEYVVEHKLQRKAKDYAQRYVEAFSDIKRRDKNSLLFFGGCGSGKTHLACAIANKLRERDIKCVFTTFEDMLLRIRDTYNKQELSDNSIRNLYKKADLLILDDLAKEKATEFSTSVLFDIVNYRYENLYPMVITANHDRETLIKRLTPKEGDETKADAIVSRLYEMCITIPMEGIKDYRRTEL